ncbi:Stk1 family PASTA domain-containing Ser/Thr kinase [uncultured Oscillibacter sp.]|uniref:Stk1 family PASTA domain-containing Ser/Thr kinase n=1 Tax=uncultured Oscillibacter sp. TaxID=876091 RepID=UPI001F8A58A7|nr:Stk1 family PASTA domain-containing Ser/Thr kinase [uncultured Oscillibacter sp.]HJB76360.1 Stk1 family PASTA domain-containing Ser/Thr kinase [Candidatus Oscillibacter avistercoris]
MEHKDPYIGRMLDNRYEILERIGTGGMAVVYKAKCHRLNRLVAVKILKSDLAQDEDFRRRFNAESQAVAQLSHPNIVSVYDVSRGGDIEYIVMELIDGITLKQYMEKRGQLNWRESLHFVTQIMRGLSHAHSRGIVHRDIKPQNVMVLRDGSVKVADFGIACLENAAQTLTQEALGSVHYISPEQARGDRIDARSDIYSAGVVLYEMLTGRLPFEGDSAVSVAIQHLSSVPLAPREINPDIPEQLELICMKAMAPDLDKRYPSADAMIADLEAFRKNPGVNLDFELSDLRTEESDEPTQKLRTPVPPQSHRPGRESSYERSRRYEDDRYDERPSRLSGGKKAALIGGGAVVVVVVLFFLFRAIFASMVPAAADTYAVPRLIGMTEEQANQQASVADGTFQVVVAGTEASDAAVGEIVRQDPEPETEKKGELPITINVWISAGEDVGTMPDLTTNPVTYEQALTILQDLVEEYELNIQPYEETQKEYNDELAADVIISTTPTAEAELHKGDTITFVLSRGPQTVPLIPLEGLELSQAQKQLDAMGLVAEVHEEASDTVQEGYIIRQNPEATTEVPAGSTVELWVSTGPEDSTGEEGMEMIMIPLPDDRETVTLQVLQDGNEILNETVNCADYQYTFPLPVYGSGTSYVEILIDGQHSSASQEVTFGGL